jgi:DNA-binding transcriptional MocR family regulator
LFKIVAVSLDAFRSLPSAQDRWLLTCFSAYVDKAGRAFCSLRQLVPDARMSLPTVSRRMAAMAAQGVFQRQRKPGGRYHYVLAEAYRPRWPGKAKRGVSAERQAVPPVQAGVSQHATQQAKPTKQDRKADAQAREADDLKWRAALRRLREHGLWVASYGPLPGQPGCRVPSELLRAPVQ